MKLKDLRVRTQMQLGLGMIMLLVAMLGAFAWYQAQNLWQETKGLYEHPLAVRRALGNIRSDALTIHLETKNLFLAETDQEIQAITKNIDVHEVSANKQFNILYDRYLGPRTDVDASLAAFAEWENIRNETIRLLLNGNRSEAADRTKPGGLGEKHAEALLAKLENISEFASQRGDKYYADAKRHQEVAMIELGVMLAAIFMLCTGIGYYLYQRIRNPLRELGSVTNQFRQGNLNARSQNDSANELGELAGSFNALAAAVEFELHAKESATEITEVMLSEEALPGFCHALLAVLIQQTGSQLGAIYLLNEQKSHFEHYQSIGLAAAGRKAFSMIEREGEFGTVLATKKIQHIADIADDTRLTFNTVSAEFRPREIITIPVLSGEDVVAVLSLASVRPYSGSALRLVNDIWGVLTARLNGVLVLQKVRDFSEKLAHQNHELEAQKTELAVQGDELSEQNIELELQKRQLDDANRLKSVFLSNMSHELRTPLNSVIALAGVLSRRLAKTIPEEEYSYLEIIERNGKNLLELINDILYLSRIESGKEEILLSRFSVRELVSDLVAMIAPQSREKNISLPQHGGGGVAAYSQ